MCAVYLKVSKKVDLASAQEKILLLCVVIDLTRLIVVIIFKYEHILNHYILYLKLI